MHADQPLTERLRAQTGLDVIRLLGDSEARARLKLVGVLDIENASPHYFREDHVQAITILASQLAVALDNAILYDRVSTQEAQLNQDLRLARELQKRLLPGDLLVMRNADICSSRETT